MTNAPHAGKFSEVWKHLVLGELLADIRPSRYAETHSGNPHYPCVEDAERSYGIHGFLSVAASSSDLAGAVYASVARAAHSTAPATHAGSPAVAASVLPTRTELLLCDTDLNTGKELVAWARGAGLAGATISADDGVRTVAAWARQGPPETTFVHIDPFDPFDLNSDGESPLSLASDLIRAGFAVQYWYGYDRPGERAWAHHYLAGRTGAALWCGDFLTVGAAGPAAGSSLGAGTTAGVGSGVVLANVPASALGAVSCLGRALAAAWADRALPGGGSGHLDWAEGTSAAASADEGDRAEFPDPATLTINPA